LVGTHTVRIYKLTCDTKWASLAVTIMASGRMLTPVLVFKGMLAGCIAKWDFATYPCRCIYACQSSAWMDEVVMLQWVEQVLKPHILELPLNGVPRLLLDSYRCHMMASVMQINEMGVKVQNIPGGCTGLSQPVDIGVAKWLEDELINRWESWMIEEEAAQDGELPRKECIDSGKTPPPKREKIHMWTIAACQSIST